MHLNGNKTVNTVTDRKIHTEVNIFMIQLSHGIRGFSFSMQPLQQPTTFSVNSYRSMKVLAS
jgi:hypothetical protein